MYMFIEFYSIRINIYNQINDFMPACMDYIYILPAITLKKLV